MRKNHSKIVCIKLVHLPYLPNSVLCRKEIKRSVVELTKLACGWDQALPLVNAVL